MSLTNGCYSVNSYHCFLPSRFLMKMNTAINKEGVVTKQFKMISVSL